MTYSGSFTCDADKHGPLQRLGRCCGVDALSQHGRAFSHDVVDSDTNVIDVAIRRLRAKVDDPFSTRLIRTVRGMGYVLDAGDEN